MSQVGICFFCGLSGELDVITEHVTKTHLIHAENSQAASVEEITENKIDENQNTQLEPNSPSEETQQGTEWNDSESKLMLDKYEQYIKIVGPMKKFKRKKDMWAQISNDLKSILNADKTPLQCENRYKTILKRKKKAVDNNHTTGSQREEVPYEEELARIVSLDDSIEPEIRIDATQCEQTKKGKPEIQINKKSKKEKALTDVLQEIHEKQEAARERRHREKLSCMREIMKEFLNKDNSKE